VLILLAGVVLLAITLGHAAVAASLATGNAADAARERPEERSSRLDSTTGPRTA
jgi:hypothetical protein